MRFPWATKPVVVQVPIFFFEELLARFRIGETVNCWLAAATNLLIIKGKC
jgi:hypothetical protein